MCSNSDLTEFIESLSKASNIDPKRIIETNCNSTEKADQKKKEYIISAILQPPFQKDQCTNSYVSINFFLFNIL